MGRAKAVCAQDGGAARDGRSGQAVRRVSRESAQIRCVTCGVSNGREQVSRARHVSQVGASSAGGSSEAECGV
jgi:hypothetical protein